MCVAWPQELGSRVYTEKGTYSVRHAINDDVRMYFKDLIAASELDCQYTATVIPH